MSQGLNFEKKSKNARLLPMGGDFLSTEKASTSKYFQWKITRWVIGRFSDYSRVLA